MLAVDRTNEKVADLYLPHHPSVLRSLKKIVDAALKKKIDVSICGDMADDEKYLFYFLGIGIRKFSLEARYIPKIQKEISSLDLKAVEREIRSLLTKSKITEIAQIVERRTAA